MNKLIWLGLVLLVSLGACRPEEERAVKIDKYFDLVGLLDSQTEMLFESGARLEKKLVANGEEEIIMIVPDSVGQFRAELKLFYEADINKLGLDDAYFSEELPGVNGGKKVITTAKKKGVNVRLIERDYQQGFLRQIRVLIEDKNDIYSFEKQLLMDFETIDGTQRLKAYTIIGSQDMVMKSELNFSITGIVVNP